jgi:predicted RNA-binding Zn-ribbon protein involved in translation (DUF1610 family)
MRSARSTQDAAILRHLANFATRFGSPPYRRSASEARFAALEAALLLGIPMVAVDPRYTSQTCPCCGSIDRANRKSQALFLCISCGHTAPADHTAAINIAAKAVVTRPQVLAPSLGVGKSPVL